MLPMTFLNTQISSDRILGSRKKMVVLPELCYQCCVKHVVLKNPLCVPSTVFRICFDNLAWFVRLCPAKGAAAAAQRLIYPVS